MNSNVFVVKVIIDPDRLLDWVVDVAVNADPVVEASGSVLDLLNYEIAHLHKVGFLPVPAVSGDYLREALTTIAQPSAPFLCNESLLPLLAEFMHRLLVLEQPIEFHEVVQRLADIAGLTLTTSDEVAGDEVVISSPVALAEAHRILVCVKLPRQLRKLSSASGGNNRRRRRFR
ncbi:hypothetical protein [Mesorhizobium sp. M7A.F.Ce.TU.012.03.2.1]|uniref:hypothetical protein n=1 Tax=Mesorhizobium sp. M7A.F.Ce.TU.012.03.2.1 TaxID=2493681 RepID=UPI000FD9913F|nr:hypothetical protein [Mesorhizobium sp. M7A.F.Ce.TU.012.03.2.1]AZV18149.1 hypothetical protein EJ079_03095 [Mesorhizobium sp. M7A.F.Ce.TU.012.03.2.1]